MRLDRSLMMTIHKNQGFTHFTLAALLLAGCNPTASAVAEPSPRDQEPVRRSIVGSTDARAIRSAATDPAVLDFYEKGDWKPVWLSEAEKALDEALSGRAAHGLDRIAFLGKPADKQSPAQREVALTSAALRYARALASGLVDPASLHQIYTLKRPEPDVSAGLRDALKQGRLGSWLARLAPQDDDYAQLSRAYLSFREEARAPNGQRFETSTIIRSGDTDSRIPAIVRQLVEDEYLTGIAKEDSRAAESDLYTEPTAKAVKQLQRDFGIAADGVIGPHTLEVLNLRPGDRAQAIAVALERRRWLSRTPPATRIDVNIAAARLRYYRGGNLADSRRVIVGKPGKETPLLLAPIFRLVANPTWTIPRSIQRGEMAGVSRAYLRRHNMVRRGGWIVQRSGPSNALGLVKFDMRDDQAIYLHDTSAPALFARSQRHLSHGCVRVEDALGFAAILAADEGVTAEWERARASGKQSFVALPMNIPVRLLYRNVFIDDAGDVAFRTDPYAWNAPVAEALGFGKGSNAKVRADPIDVGP